MVAYVGSGAISCPGATVESESSEAQVNPQPPSKQDFARGRTAQSRSQRLSRCAAIGRQDRNIGFDRADAELDSASYPTLERLAAVAGQCPNVRFEVAGHADGDGREENNQRLSERRAQAVLDHLARSGVPVTRMSAVGYGMTRPLVPNTTIENKAKNRRIEFVVKTD